jgi:hypothetical protein
MFKKFVFKLLCIAFLVVTAVLASSQTAWVRGVAMPSTTRLPPAIVIGFVGGFIGPNSSVHGTVKIAARLHKIYTSGVFVKVYENRHGEEAYREILRLLDVNHVGALSPAEKQEARIILYGHSWGASEAVSLARKLDKVGVPVLLTIQVDSVRKPGENDSVIPSNVVQAVNFYQSSGLIHGRAVIRAADPQHTQIIGNFKFDYAQHPISCVGYPWYARLFEKQHIEIECDPNVLDQVEALIRTELSAPAR